MKPQSFYFGVFIMIYLYSEIGNITNKFDFKHAS